MLTQKRLEELQGVDIRLVDKNTLADMSGFQFDNSLSQAERAKRVFTKIRNPYLFRLGDMAVEVAFTENAPPLQDMMDSFLKRQKCGI